MASTETTQQAVCQLCGRKLAKSTGAYGPKCAAKVRAAAKAADLSEYKPRQLEDARELIEDGGVVPTARPGVFRTVSTDGQRTYLTTTKFCTCKAGLKGSACYHRAAVVIVTGTDPAPAPVPVPAPRPAPTDADLWAELDRLTDAFMAIG